MGSRCRREHRLLQPAAWVQTSPRKHSSSPDHASSSSHLALLDVSHGDRFLHTAAPLTPSPPAAAPLSPTEGSVFFPNRRWRPSPPYNVFKFPVDLVDLLHSEYPVLSGLGGARARKSNQLYSPQP